MSRAFPIFNSKKSLRNYFVVLCAPLVALTFPQAFAGTGFDEDQSNEIDWSLSYTFSPGDQPALSELSTKTLSANYHAFSIDGTRGDWSWGVNAGTSKSSNNWEANNIDELAELSARDRGFYIAKKFNNWSVSANVHVSKSRSNSLFTRHFPNRNLDYINVDVAQAFEFSELSLGTRVAYGDYLDKVNQNWWFNVDITASYHSAESQQMYQQSNRLLVNSPQMTAYLRDNPALAPGVIRSDLVDEKNEFWSREFGISIDRDVDFSSWFYSASFWLSYLHYDAPEGSLAYSRTVRGTRPLLRNLKYDVNEQLIAADHVWYYGLNNYVTFTEDFTINFGVTFSSNRTYEGDDFANDDDDSAIFSDPQWSVGAQLWF